jgi:superfamily II DNA or RNA helicase
VLAQRLFVEKADLPSSVIDQIKRLAAFQNPEFYKKQSMRLSTATTPRVIACAEDLRRHVGLPRGCRSELEKLLGEHGVTLDVAKIQSLVRKGEVDDIVASYGQVIVDECHHLPAASFERVLAEVKARYVAGLTATPQRRDGHHPITEMQLGPVRFAIDPRRRTEPRPFAQRLIARDTGFKTSIGEDAPRIQDLYAALAADEPRNALIIGDVIRSLEEGRSPILLTERKDHLEFLASRLERFARHVVVLRGGMSARERRAMNERLAGIPDREERLVLATGRYIGEGFDDARLDTLFLTLPVSWKGTLIQYTGRLHRLHPRKREVRIFDYVDREVPMLLRMFERRLRGYRAIGYARGEAPLGFGETGDERVVEYDEEALRTLDDPFA